MWDWISCHLCARHEYCVCPEAGSVFLRCIHCGRRSNGWTLGSTGAAPTAHRQSSGSPGRLLRRAFRSGAHAH